jgi:D-glycero-D-manno-heptose 1,7-bisphosphate phosphatase
MPKGMPALFLDRDGVINRNHGYVYRVSDFEFFPEIFDICQIAQKADMTIVVITNQSGIGRGYFTEKEFHSLTDWMVSEFARREIRIHMVLHAPENPEIDACLERRKPSPFMIIEAAEKLGINLADSILIGDSETDVIAADRAGIKHTILIASQDISTVASVSVENHKECLGIVAQLVEKIRSEC